jgi:hypothetical protein
LQTNNNEQTKSSAKERRRRPAYKDLPAAFEEFLPALLLMAVFSQSFFTLVRRNFMTLSFFTTRHNSPNDL